MVSAKVTNVGIDEYIPPQRMKFSRLRSLRHVLCTPETRLSYRSLLFVFPSNERSHVATSLGKLRGTDHCGWGTEDPCTGWAGDTEGYRSNP